MMSSTPIEIIEYCDYLAENYIDCDTSFNPNEWASEEFDKDRTTDACESFHAKYNSYFGSSSPNIYDVVEILMEWQEEIFIMIRSANDFPRKITNQHKFEYDRLITRCDFVKKVSIRTIKYTYQKTMKINS